MEAAQEPKMSLEPHKKTLEPQETRGQGQRGLHQVQAKQESGEDRSGDGRAEVGTAAVDREEWLDQDPRPCEDAVVHGTLRGHEGGSTKSLAGPARGGPGRPSCRGASTSKGRAV